MHRPFWSSKFSVNFHSKSGLCITFNVMTRVMASTRASAAAKNVNGGVPGTGDGKDFEIMQSLAYGMCLMSGASLLVSEE